MCIGTADAHKQFLEMVQRTFQGAAAHLEDYMERVEKLDWEQLRNYKEKIEQLDKMLNEKTQLSQEYREAIERGDTTEAARLLAAITAKDNEIAAFQEEMKNNPLFEIFQKEKNEELENLLKNIFQGKQDFFKWRKKKEKETPKVEQKYLGFIPQKWGKRLMWGGGILALILVIYLIFRKIFKS